MVPTYRLSVTEFKQKYVVEGYIPRSKYIGGSEKDLLAEGVVVKNYEKQLFAKIVRPEFVERNAEVFGGSKKPRSLNGNDEEFVFKYCTNYRIEKVIMKQLDLGVVLDMKLMSVIIKETYNDIVEEEWREILHSNWKLDFKNCRKLIADRCREVLNNMIRNNAR
jgi:hypothetical protein